MPASNVFSAWTTEKAHVPQSNAVADRFLESSPSHRQNGSLQRFTQAAAYQNAVFLVGCSLSALASSF